MITFTTRTATLSEYIWANTHDVETAFRLDDECHEAAIYGDYPADY